MKCAKILKMLKKMINFEKCHQTYLISFSDKSKQVRKMPNETLLIGVQSIVHSDKLQAIAQTLSFLGSI